MAGIVTTGTATVTAIITITASEDGFQPVQTDCEIRPTNHRPTLGFGTSPLAERARKRREKSYFSVGKAATMVVVWEMTNP